MADLLLGREDELAAIERFLTAVAGTTVGGGAGPATPSDGARPRLERA